jgi:nitrile hydratase accessory protein
MSDAPQPVFEEPWHAQLFALTVHLNETGHFAWPDWAARFSGTLMDHGLSGELDGGDDYFTAWLATLEEYLAQLKMADPQAVEQMRAAWEHAYLHTAHGDPVTLDGAAGP